MQMSLPDSRNMNQSDYFTAKPKGIKKQNTLEDEKVPCRKSAGFRQPSEGTRRWSNTLSDGVKEESRSEEEKRKKWHKKTEKTACCGMVVEQPITASLTWRETLVKVTFKFKCKREDDKWSIRFWTKIQFLCLHVLSSTSPPFIAFDLHPPFITVGL
ncbi:hypothetical protein RchiOBHm_Chr7g0230271 [Rosa chinensis]|uniref:Uncharacterized protein n=1 Tax=Rosa chinensis TaxID=74649 RepID=A0A2P6PFC6_ROSCH|nr:hypothetical protein RchiOBHm_Chr7g0230271 [Rosa chinensis]